ncbi:MAG: hypothetical protein ABL998_04980 [Planctomycetota bacterium]
MLLVDGVAEVTTHTETPATIRDTTAWFSLAAGPSRLLEVARPEDARVFGYLIEE